MEAGLTVPFHAMASACAVTVTAETEAAARLAAQAAEAEVRRLEAKYSRYRADSILSLINQGAGGPPVTVDAETAGLLNYAALCWAHSDGRFDITSGVLRRAWDFRRAVLPAAAEIRAVMPLVGWDKVEWGEGQIRLSKVGMEIDLGGVVKEYAADRAAAVCLEAGAGSVLVNLGGDLRAAGPPPHQRPWLIGIRHPRAPHQVAARVLLGSGGLATSGDYERFFEVGGRRFCHVLDPRTGWPVDSPPASVSVAAPACLAAGSLSTLGLLVGAEAAPGLLAAAGLPWMILDAEGVGQGPLATQS